MRTIFRIVIFFLLTNACSERARVQILNLKCEYKVKPLGVGIEKPHLSWTSESNQRGFKQSAYQVSVASSQKNLDENMPDIWDSKKILSDQSTQIAFKGKPLESNHNYFWKVKIWNQNGETFLSSPTFWTTGLFHESDWKAKWIGLDKTVGIDDTISAHKVLSARMLRHEFSVGKKIKSATAFISGLGLFELYLNGEKIGDQVLAPGLTEYNKRAFYMTFDVTGNLQPGNNAIGVILGNGRFFAMRAGGTERTKTYGFPKVICQLNIEYEDGTVSSIVSDESWKLTTNGPIRKNSEYDGEYYDARMELKDWSKINFDDAGWINAVLVGKPGEKLDSQPIEPIKIMEQIAPVAVKILKPGTFIFDMGQNMVGWVELFVKGNKGDKVTLRFAERLNNDGTLYLDNIRTAEVTDTYILKGDGEEKWEPRFTYHGFQFVEMSGYPGVPALSAIRGKVVHDAMEVTGTFSCSNPVINGVYKNSFWGIRGNYRSIPTDCPQRDERQGWLGDRSAECTGESYIFDISKLYSKWVTDIRDTQLENGNLSDVAPSYWPFYTDNTTWPGTFLFASEMLYTQYGDKKVIETNYPAMQKWVEHMSQFLNDGIMPKDMYGDWCVPPEDVRLTNSTDPQRITRSDYIGTAYFCYELKLMAKFALLLGKKVDAEAYSKTAELMKSAFNTKFLDRNMVKYTNNTCTANILALAFDLVPDEYKDKIVDNLLQKILSENGGHLGHGIIGGQWMMRALTNNGHADVAYKLASTTTYPGWGYMVQQGATTIWELWNGSYGDPGMNSGNHVMLLGDLIIWYYENLAGIRPDPAVPGFSHIIMKPYVVGDLTHVNASYNSIRGMIKSGWKLDADQFSWEVTIPANSTATLYVPTLNKEEVMEGNKPASKADGVKFVRWEDNLALFEIQSGNYTFISKGVKKITTGHYLATPVITPKDTVLISGTKTLVRISCADSVAVIRYTIDGSELKESSPVYTEPLEISGNTVVKAQAFGNGYHSSNQSKVVFNFVDPAKNGIIWTLYTGKFIRVPDFSRIKPVKMGNVFSFSLVKMDIPKHNIALQLKSFIQIDKGGKYTFYLTSNDGSNLYVDGKLLIDNDSEHGAKEMSNSIQLSKGKHEIRVEYFQGGGGKVLSLSYSSEEISYQPLPEFILFKSGD
jgi:alpha-L-rhamnosidase